VGGKLWGLCEDNIGSGRWVSLSTVLFHLSLSLKDFANWPASWSSSPSLFPFQLEEIDERGLEEAGRRGIYRPVSSVERD